MKQYLLATHSVEGEPLPLREVLEQIYRDVQAFNTELREAGAWVFAGGVHPESTATVVRVRDGELLITDGPFAETKEHLGGFWVIQAADLDAALAWSGKAAAACGHPVEVRPFAEYPEH